MRTTDQLNALRQTGNWAEVEQLARQELERDPHDGFFLRALEQSLREQGRADEAPEIWETLVDELGENYPYAGWLASHVLGTGDQARATAYFRLGAEGCLQAKDFDSFEEIWLELAELIPAELDYFLGLAGELERRRERGRAGELLQLLLPAYEAGSSAPLLRLLRRIVELAPKDRRMRTETQRIFRNLYGGRRDLTFLIEQSGLVGETPLDQAVAELERYLPYGAGQSVFHQEWGTGVVSRLEPRSGKIVIDFPGRPGHAMDFELARKTLEPVAADDLRALSREERQRLKEAEPAALIHAALRSCGGKASGRELKDILYGEVVPENEWTGWWGSVSRTLKTDPRVHVTGGGSRVYALRDEEIRFEDEVCSRFDQARRPLEKVDVYLEYLGHCRSYPGDLELLGHMAEVLRSLAAAAREPAIRVEIAYVLEALGTVAPDLAADKGIGFEEMARDPAMAVKVTEGLRSPEHEARWAEVIKENHADAWPAIFADLILSPSVSARDSLSDALLAIPDGADRLREVFEKASAAPREYPGPFIWFCQRWILRPAEGKAFGQNPCGLLERLFRLVDHLAFAGRRMKGKAGLAIRQHAADIRAFVKRNSFRALKQAAEGATPVAAESLRNAIVSNAGLDPAARSEALRIVRTRFPHLAEEEEKPGGVPAEGPRPILCTRAALQERREELRRVTEVEIPANAREIEEARSHGDLSENAEYKFAKERQTMLHDRARDLQDSLLNARPVDLAGVSTDRVGFGTRVTLRDPDGATLTYAILGPWEVGSEKGVLSYLSDDAAPLMGREAGSRVVIGIGETPVECEIVAIEKAAEIG